MAIESITLAHNEAGRVSFPSLFEKEKDPRRAPDKHGYVVTLLFPKDSPALPKLRALANRAFRAKYPNAPQGTVPRNPFLEGNVKYNRKPDTYAGYQDMIEVRFRTMNKPAVFGPYRDAAGNIMQITDPAEVYPGCWAVVRCHAYAWQNPDYGVSFGFSGIQKVRDDESFAGGSMQDPEAAGFGEVPGATAPTMGGGAPVSGDDDWLGAGDPSAGMDPF